MTSFNTACSVNFLKSENNIISVDKTVGVLKTLICLTLPFQDREGRQIRLWKTEKYGLIGSVLESDGTLRIIPKDRIWTPLSSNKGGNLLLECLEKVSLRRWDLVFDAKRLELIIWPYLQAAGKDPRKAYNLPRNAINNTAQSFNAREALKNKIFTLAKLSEGKGIDARKELPDGRIRYYAKETPSSTPGPTRGAGLVYEHNPKTGRIRSWFECRDHSGNVNRVHPKNIDGLTLKAPHYPPTKKELEARAQTQQTPGGKQFTQTLQQTKLTSSYNSNHPHNPVQEKGGTGGEIGGVACSMEYFKGLFDSPEALFEDNHFFSLPALPDGTVPFSNDELRQILRELAIGIYSYSTIPFFSLHFNQNSDLFPVIHPVYENTLVGRVIGMLDYIMKGYLNGGIFQETFIQEWYQNADWESQSNSALQQMIDFEEYCKAHLKGEDRKYFSLRQFSEQFIDPKRLEVLFQNLIGKDGGEKGGKTLLQERMAKFSGESEILRDFSEFSNSFRIIAKQNSIQKEENLFLIDADFDVFYTIVPSPRYKEAYDEFIREHGQPPASYQALEESYQLFTHRIHDHLVKFPLCQKYFSMLSVINFFSGYFATLKKHCKQPLLSQFQGKVLEGCPPLFPHLPIKKRVEEDFKANLFLVYNSLRHSHRDVLENFYLNILNEISETPQPLLLDQTKNTLIEKLRPILEKHILQQTSRSIASYLQLHLEDEEKFNKAASNIVDLLADIGKNIFTELENHFTLNNSLFYLNNLEKQKLIAELINQNPLKNKLVPLFRISLPCMLIQPDIESKEVTKGKRIVGGCGMKLATQQVQPSPTAEVILQNNWSKMMALEPEKWKKVKMSSGVVKYVFRLFYEDVPAWQEDRYEGMDALLMASGEDRAGYLSAWFVALEAMQSGRKGDFKNLLESESGLREIKDKSGRTLLNHAALLEDPDYVELLLAKKFSLREKDGYGYVPLHYAAMGHSRILQLLIKKHTSQVHATSKNGATPLIIAIQHRRGENVSLLLAAGAKNATLAGGYNTLHCALHHEDEQIARLLIEGNILDNKAINLCAEEGGTPLMLACELDSLEMVKYLIEKGADPSLMRKDGMSALEIALRRNCAPIVRYLITRVKPSDSAISTAAKECSLEIVEILSQHRKFYSFRNGYNDHVLHIAIRYGNIPVALYLVNQVKLLYVQEKNKGEETALDLAISAGCWDLIEALEKKGAKVHMGILKRLVRLNYYPYMKKIFNRFEFLPEQLQSLLQVAAESGNHEVITMVLIPLGANLIDLQGSNGWKMVHYLAKSDGIYLFKQEIAKVQDLYCRDETGKTLAYIAAENGSLRVLSFLLNEMKNRSLSLDKHFNDRHLLYAAIASRKVTGVKLIFDLFKDPSLPNTSIDGGEMRPAHLAAQIGSKEILKLLLKKGANFQIEDHYYCSPLYYGLRMEDIKTVKFILKEYGISIRAHDLYMAAAQEQEKIWMFVAQQISHQGLPNEEYEALKIAVRERNSKAVIRLLSLGIPVMDVNQEDGNWTPILWAAANGQIGILELLLQGGSLDQTFVKNRNALHWACANGHAGCVNLLLKAGYSTNTKDRRGASPAELSKGKEGVIALLNGDIKYFQNIEAFQKALEEKNLKSLLFFLRYLPPNETVGITLNGKKRAATPFQHFLYAIQQVDSSLVDEMLKKGANPNQPDSKGNTWAHLLIMAQFSPLEIQEIDLNKKNHAGQTALHLAAEKVETDSSALGFFKNSLFFSLLEALTPDQLNAKDHKGRTPIFYAIQGRNEENVKLLLKKRVDLNLQDFHLLSPLFLASARGNFSIVKLLVENGADLNQPNTSESFTALYYALADGKDEMARYFLLHGADCSIASRDGTFPIHLASAQGKLNLMQLFAAKGQSLETRDRTGKQPIHYAAIQGKNKVLEALTALDVLIDTPLKFEPIDDQNSDQKKNKQKKNFNGATPLLLAAHTGQASTVDWLLNHHANPELTTENNMTILSAASNSTLVLERLREYKFTEDPSQISPAIIRAVQRDNVEALKTLLSWGISIDTPLEYGFSALHYASLYGSLQCTQFLLQQGADPCNPSHSGETALELSATRKSVEQFQMLLMDCSFDFDFELDRMNSRGETLMHLAAKAGNLSHLLYLIAAGASTKLTDVDGCTPLHLAAREGKHNVLTLLVAFGSDIAALSVNGMTPEQMIQKNDTRTKQKFQQITRCLKELNKDASFLHFAIKMGDFPSILLLTQFEEVNQPDEEGTAPLHLAVALNQTKTIRRLLSQGAIPDIRNKKEETPLSIACFSRKDPQMVRFLVKAGADPEPILKQLKTVVFPEKPILLLALKRKTKSGKKGKEKEAN
ncbi:ankyrin repeat domain-containing protein [Neochlamydia sp. AcF65]|uniref:ankyrin repeat domain-containing protein n=1 Tax=Neochlamydia sp. AcF65 TaxID=2795735 RepID=UPI001BC8F1F0|nr:ankyrin repeat domain-containing protein [Neochlamydia sp. AcF65]